MKLNLLIAGIGKEHVKEHNGNRQKPQTFYHVMTAVLYGYYSHNPADAVHEHDGSALTKSRPHDPVMKVLFVGNNDGLAPDDPPDNCKSSVKGCQDPHHG